MTGKTVERLSHILSFRFREQSKQSFTFRIGKERSLLGVRAKKERLLKERVDFSVCLDRSLVG